MAKSSGGSGRDVMFRVGLQEHPATKAVLRSIQQQTSQTEQAVQRGFAGALSGLARVSTFTDAVRKLDDAANGFGNSLQSRMSAVVREVETATERFLRAAESLSRAQTRTPSEVPVVRAAATVMQQGPALSDTNAVRENESMGASNMMIRAAESLEISAEQMESAARGLEGVVQKIDRLQPANVPGGRAESAPTNTGSVRVYTERRGVDSSADDQARQRLASERAANEAIVQDARLLGEKVGQLRGQELAEYRAYLTQRIEAMKAALQAEMQAEAQAGEGTADAIRKREEAYKRAIGTLERYVKEADKRGKMPSPDGISMDSAEQARQDVQKARNVTAAGLRPQVLGTGEKPSVTKFMGQSLEEQERVIQARIAGETRAFTAVSGLQGEALKNHRKAVAERVELMGKELESVKRMASEEYAAGSQAVSKVLASRKRAIEESIRELERYGQALEKTQAQEEREAQRQHDRHRQRQRSIAAANRAAREQADAEAKTSLQVAEQRFEQANMKFRGMDKALVERSLSVAEGVARAARGFAMLGLVGEEESLKIVKGLIKVQAAFDMVVGSIKTTAGVMESLRMYNDAMSARGAAQSAADALNTVRSGAAGAAGAAVGEGVGAVAGGAGRQAAGRAAGRTGGVVGSVVAGAAGSAAATAATAAATGTGAAGAGAGAAGAGAAAPAAGVGTAAIPAVAGLAAALSAGFAAIVGKQTIGAAVGRGGPGFGQGVQQGSVSDVIATYETKFFATLQKGVESLAGRSVATAVGNTLGTGLLKLDMGDALQEFNDSAARLEAGEKARAAREAARQMREETGAVLADRRSASLQNLSQDRARRAEMEQLRFRPDESGRQRTRELESMIENRQQLASSRPFANVAASREDQVNTARDRQEQRLLGYTKQSEEMQRQRLAVTQEVEQAELAVSDALRAQQELLRSNRQSEVERQKAADDVAAAQERYTAAQRQQLSLQQQMTREVRAGIEAAVSGIEKEIALNRQAANAAREKLQAAKERFADLAPDQQQRVLLAGQRLRANEKSVAETGLTTQEQATMGKTDVEVVQRRQAMEQAQNEAESVKKGAGFRQRQQEARDRALAAQIAFEQAEAKQLAQREFVQNRQREAQADQSFMSDFKRREEIGPDRVTNEERERAAEIEERRRTRVASGIRREDRSLLEQAGTEYEQDVVRRSKSQEAERRGFGRVYGGQEQEEIRAREQAEQRLQVELKDTRKLEAKIIRDDTQVVDEIVNDLATRLAAMDRTLRATIEQRLTERLGAVTTKQNAKRNAEVSG